MEQAGEGRIKAAFWSAWARLVELPAVARGVRTLVVVASGLRQDPITLRAAALTYLTVLSLVPLLAVVFVLFQAVVGTEALRLQLTDFLIDNLAVGLRDSTQRAVEQHLRRSTGAAVGGVGFAFLLVSAVSLLGDIESAFNHIFHAPRPRPLLARLGLYWSLLTLGPVFLALSVAGTALLGSQRHLGALRPLAGLLLPLLVTYGAFFLLYQVVPAVRVRRRAALVGALVAGTAWEAAKLLYAAWSARSVRASALYGSLSAVPTFLLWTYVSWVLVLFGARVAYAAQWSHGGYAPARPRDPLPHELQVARLFLAVARAFRTEGGAVDTVALATRLQLEEARVRELLAPLAEAGLVRELAGGGWVPGRDPATITVDELRRAARGEAAMAASTTAPLPPDLAALQRLWSQADAAADDQLRNAPLAPLVTLSPEG